MDLALEKQEQPGRLLIVDDEEPILRAIQRLLSRGQWQIETANSAETALDILERFAPDVVLSDFRMPGMNGVDFLAKVKERFPRTQRIMLTGQADHVALEEAINRSEVFRLITKPWNDGQLMLTVKSAFEQHALHAENERLYRLTQEQNLKLRNLNADLEQRVHNRAGIVARRGVHNHAGRLPRELAGAHALHGSARVCVCVCVWWWWWCK
jgi:two-component system NtrC family sensor kinase